jgi:hypothetical protein
MWERGSDFLPPPSRGKAGEGAEYDFFFNKMAEFLLELRYLKEYYISTINSLR